MPYLLELIIFLIVLFLYIHVNYHVSTSNDLEIYELNEISKEKIEDICSLKQPVIINSIIDVWRKLNKTSLSENNNYSKKELSIRNTSEIGSSDELYLPLEYSKAVKLFNNDKKGLYYSENNEDFLIETALDKLIKSNDLIFRPPLNINSYYDIHLGSNESYTPLRYEICHKNYLYVTSGSIDIKLIPPSFEKNLHPTLDYENFEFKSSINPWNVQKEFEDDLNRVKIIDVTITEGQSIFIPPYWYYSVKNSNESVYLSLKYRNYFNLISISPYLVMHFTQIQNIKREKYKKRIFEDIDEEENIITEIKEKEE